MRELVIMTILGFALLGCCAGERWDVIRYDASGSEVQRWYGVTRYEVEGACIRFDYGCEGPTESWAMIECGNVAVVPAG